jgi:hypothetical protein
VSQIQAWDDGYEKNVKGSKAKAFVKGLKEAKRWLATRKHVFPTYHASSTEDDDQDSSQNASEESASTDSDSIEGEQQSVAKVLEPLLCTSHAGLVDLTP